jgi:hypothetical protein
MTWRRRCSSGHKTGCFFSPLPNETSEKIPRVARLRRVPRKRESRIFINLPDPRFRGAFREGYFSEVSQGERLPLIIKVRGGRGQKRAAVYTWWPEQCPAEPEPQQLSSSAARFRLPTTSMMQCAGWFSAAIRHRMVADGRQAHLLIWPCQTYGRHAKSITRALIEFYPRGETSVRGGSPGLQQAAQLSLRRCRCQCSRVPVRLPGEGGYLALIFGHIDAQKTREWQ